MKTDITPERLRERLRYDPDTGVFTWHKGVTCRAGVGRIGAAAGGKKRRYLGTFDSPEAAHRAYLAAKAIEHEGYAR